MQDRQYRPDIDGLRAIAVSSVVVFHAFPGKAPGGFVGVDVFFVISGFLISGIIIDGIRRGTFSFAQFYARRIRRIFPALAIVLFSVVVIGWLTLLPDEYRLLLKHVVSGAAFVSNVTLWTEAGYFDTASELKPLVHLWSLGVEEQFYILWPLTLMAAWWLGKRVGLCIALFAVASFALNLYLIGDYPVATFFLPATRFWELMLGAAILFVPFEKASPRAKEIVATAGLLLIGLSIFSFDKDVPFPGWRALLPTLGAAFVIAAGRHAWCNRALLSNRWAVLIGLISYPLYLWHWPLLSFARIVNFPMSTNEDRLLKLALVGLSVVLAYATYRLLELKIRSSPVPKYVFSLCASIAGVCALGLLFNQPFARVNATASNPFAWAETRWDTPGCLARFGMDMQPNPFCVDHHPDVPPAVLLIGDSHANHWMPGMTAAQPNRPILHLGVGACPYMENVDSISPLDDLPHQRLCRLAMSRIFEIIRTTPSIGTVILSARNTAQIPGPAYGDLRADPTRILKAEFAPGKSNAEVYAEGLRRTLAQLAALKKKTVIILDIPELGFDPTTCVRLRRIDVLKSARPDCRVARELVDARQRPYRAVIRAVAADFPDVEIIDPNKVLCDGQWCHAIKDGLVLYRDEDHLGALGSEYVWRQIQATR